jgi:hypothetical protein
VANSACLIVFGEREKGAPITTQQLSRARGTLSVLL